MADGEATQQGVSRRDRDMEDLLKRREEEALEDNEDLEEDDLETDDDEDLEEDDEEDLEEDEEDLEPDKGEDTPESMVFKGDDGKEYTVPLSASTVIKIDGEEVAAPVSQITQRYQKGAAGEIRLQQAGELKKDLEQREEALTAKEAQFLDRMDTAQQQQTTGDLSQDDYKDKVRELIEAVVEADEERAVELFSTVYKPPQDNSAQLVTDITASVRKDLDAEASAKEQKKYNAKLVKAGKRFNKEYKELAADGRLFELVDNETDRIAKEDPTAEPWDIISRAAEKIKKWHGGTSKKRRKKTTPTPAGGRASIGEDKKPKATRSTILNDMRAARGQPAL